MVNNKNLIGIVNSLLEGQVSIEQVWNDYGTYIRSINNCNTYDEVMSLTCVYYRYGVYLANEGYYQKSLSYLEKSLTVLTDGIHLVSKETYNNFYAEVLKYKSTVLYRLGKYRKSLECLKILKTTFPEKDEFRIDYDNCFHALLNKSINPLYLLVMLFWAIYGIDHWLLDTNFLPSWTFNIGWYFWIVLVVIQFGFPWIKRFSK